jgi:hypothetical protein
MIGSVEVRRFIPHGSMIVIGNRKSSLETVSDPTVPWATAASETCTPSAKGPSGAEPLEE